MSVIRFWFARTFRARARAYVGVAVLLALLGGLPLTSFTGARRTASAYPRFREAGNALDVRFIHVQGPDHVLEVPGVTSTATYFSFVAAAGLIPPMRT